MDPKRPCWQCPDRYPGCHDHCTKPEKLAFDEWVRKRREGAARYSEENRIAIESQFRNQKKRKR